MRTQSLQEESDGPLRIWNCPEPSFIDDALRKQLPSRIMQEFLDFVLRHLIDYPDELILTKLDAPKKTIFRIRLRQSDIGKVVGKHGYVLSKGQVKTFRIGGWHELSRKSVEITPAFYLPGPPSNDPRRDNTIAIPSIAYSTFAFDPEKKAFEVPVAAWGEEEVKLGRPC